MSRRTQRLPEAPAPAAQESDLPSVEEQLGTEDVQEQAQRIRELRARVAMPPFTVVIAYDPMTGEAQVVPVGVNLSFEVVQTALQRAQGELRKQEMEAVKQEVMRQSQKGTPPDRESLEELVKSPPVA